MAANGTTAPPSADGRNFAIPEFPTPPTPARLDNREVTNGLARISTGSSSVHSRSTMNNSALDRAKPAAAQPTVQPHQEQPAAVPSSTATAVPTKPFSGRIRPFGGRLTAAINSVHAQFETHRDVRSHLPPILSRFLGYRPPGSKAPFPPLPFPPFSWLRHLELKHEVWLLSTIGAFVGIALIEIVMATAFAGSPDGVGIIMIVASFGASAVLVYGALEAPLSQPRNLVGGQVFCAIVGVCITRLMRKAHAYELHDVTQVGDLGHVVWLNGALAMAIALLVMLITDTVHPPAGATALIAAVQPAVVAMSWRYIYIVLISSLLMLGWGMIINNVGRRRYPTYWISGKRVYVRDPPAEKAQAAEEGRAAATTTAAAPAAGVAAARARPARRPRSMSENEMMMAAVEGRNDGFTLMARALSREEIGDDVPDRARASPASSGAADWSEKAAGRTAHRD